MEIPVNNSLTGPIGRFLSGPAILLGAVLAYAEATGLSIPPRALAYAVYLFDLPCCCFFVGIAAVDRLPYGDLLQSVFSGYRLSSIGCPHFRFHRWMATTSARALESLRHSIDF